HRLYSRVGTKPRLHAVSSALRRDAEGHARGDCWLARALRERGKGDPTCDLHVDDGAVWQEFCSKYGVATYPPQDRRGWDRIIHRFLRQLGKFGGGCH